MATRSTWRAAVVAVAALALAPAGLYAQRSGGSFGGARSFGGGGGGGGGSRSFGGGSSFGGSYRPSSSSSWSRPSPSNFGSTSTPRTSTPTYPPVHIEPPRPPPPWLTATQYRRPSAQFGTFTGASEPIPRRAGDDPWQSAQVSVALPHRLRAGALGALILFAPMAAFVLVGTRGANRRRRDELGDDPTRGPAQDGPCEVRRISIAFDWSERARLQAALEQAAARVDTASVEGLYAAAKAARDLLASALPAARYAAFQSFRRQPAAAETEFARLAGALRERYEREVQRGARREELAGLRARAEEGRGLVVVSLLVGTTVHLRGLPRTLDAGALASSLAALLPATAEQLVALEVIWSPARDADRLSSAELEVVYPELVQLASGGLGRASCTYCHAVYARELGQCPACGARDPGAAARPQATGLTTIACAYCGRQTPAYEVQCAHCGARAQG